MYQLPITKGCLGAGEEEDETADGRWDGEETEGLGGEEERRLSKRRPEKWGPDAFSMA